MESRCAASGGPADLQQPDALVYDPRGGSTELEKGRADPPIHGSASSVLGVRAGLASPKPGENTT